MQVWAITVPINARNGEDHRLFRDTLALTFGGYSSYVGTGAWVEDGRTLTEAHVRYEVACEDEPNLFGLACDVFPEERAWYIAHVGEGEVRNVR